MIRGYALVEELLDEAISAAFRDGTPAELKRLRLAARLALAEALELVTSEVATAITALAKVRNRLAHGGDVVVTDEELRTLHAASEPFVRDDIFENWDKDNQLRIVVYVICEATGFTVEYALKKRAEAHAAVVAWRQRSTLSKEHVREARVRGARRARHAGGPRASSGPRARARHVRPRQPELVLQRLGCERDGREARASSF